MSKFNNLIKTTSNFFWTNINFLDPIVILSFILMVVSIIVPFIVFIIKIVYKKRKLRDNWTLCRAVRISWLSGALVFAIGFILLILKILNIF